MGQLSLFFSKIKELTFFQRIFSWSSIKHLSYDAFSEFTTINKELEQLKTKSEELKNSLTESKSKNDGLNEKIELIQQESVRKEGKIDSLNAKIHELNEAIKSLNTKVSQFESLKESQNKEYENKITQVIQVKESLEKEISRLNDERVSEKESELKKMKLMWSEHESSVKQTIQNICQNHLIKYVEQVPFRGSPDNTVEICDEYIIFDAKSPANDDLTNFPKYIKLQTDSVKKYAKQQNVKRDIFLVIPSNTINLIPQMTYNMGDYNVYVITKDSLEPVILSLKKIEEYEFADNLSPEERDNICRVIGKFAHTTKRKIQIDQFFTNQFIELLVKCKNDLPDEILTQVIEFEKAEKLNPPTEKRAKQILTKELKDKNVTINLEAQNRDIVIPESFDDIKNLE